MSKSFRTFLLVAVAGVCILAGLAVGNRMLYGTHELYAAQLFPQTRALTEVALQRGNGSDFTLDDLQGQWSLLFFGFTNCPDICPDTLRQLAQVLEELEPKSHAPLPQVVFVSVDPERDQGQAMDEYARWFNPEFVAVTGEQDELQSLTRQVGAVYYVEPTDPDTGFYNVDHTSAVMIVNPRGEVVGRFTQPMETDAVVADLFRLTR